MPDRWCVPADQEGQRAARVLLRAHGVDLGGGAALGADDARLVALGGRTATRAGSGSSRSLADLAFPKSFVWGDVGRRRAGRRRAPRSATSPPAARRDSILGNAGTEFVWGGGRLADAWPAAPDDERSTAACGRRTSRRS